MSLTITPRNIVSSAFPTGTVVDDRLVNGLTNAAIQDFRSNPNVTIVDEHHTYSTYIQNQTYFLARVYVNNNSYLMYCRICDAAEGSGYAMYAAVNAVVSDSEENLNSYLRNLSFLKQSH